MSRFYVGQRVRIKWSDYFPELTGSEGTVVGYGAVEAGPHLGKPNYEVAPDAWGGSLSPPGASSFGLFGPLPERLEPLTDGNSVISWSECVWKPEHMRAPA